MEREIKKTVIPTEIVDIWQSIVDSVSTLLSIPSAMINRLEPPELEVFRSNIGSNNPFPSGTRMPMAGIYCEAAARTRKNLQVIDARKDPEWADSPTAKAGIFAYMGYPLFWPDGDVFGTFCVVDTKENQWGKQYENVMIAFKNAIEAHLTLVNTLENLEKKNQELNRALSEVKTLRGLLPICSSCKKIRDDKGYWNQIEGYIGEHSEVEFSHGLCPDCAKRLYPDIDIYE